jgi:uncharacterized protein YwqG
MLRPRSINALIAAVRRPASVAHVLRGRPEPVAVESLIAAVRVGLRTEGWPLDANEHPLFGLAQLNLADAPFVPPSLAGVAVLTIFLGTDDDTFVAPDGRPNGYGWLLRAYPSLEGLVALAGPTVRPGGQGIRPKRLAWQRIDDVPAYEDLIGLVDSGVLDRLLDDGEVEDVVGSAASGAKLGGWPTLIQGELEWDADDVTYCVAVDSDEQTNLNLWDGGVLYLGLRGDRDPLDPQSWAATAQFM